MDIIFWLWLLLPLVFVGIVVYAIVTWRKRKAETSANQATPSQSDSRNGS